MSGFQGGFGPSATTTIRPGVTPTSGGAAGQLLFDTGSFVQESSALTWDNTNKALTITGGTLTGATSFPVLNLSQAWNNAATVFTGLKLSVTNTASAAASLLLDLQVGGLSQFSVGASGAVTFHGGGGNWSLTANGNNWAIFNTPIYALSYQLPSTGNFCFAPAGSPSNLPDLIIGRDAAGILALQNGTNAQSLRAYNTWSSAGANYERAVFDWVTTSNVLTIGTQAGGTGVARNLQFVVGGVNKLDYGITSTNNWGFATGMVVNGYVVASGSLQSSINLVGATNASAIYLGIANDTRLSRVAAGIYKIDNGSTGPGLLVTNPTTVASLPSAATAGAGARAFVTNALTPVWGAAVTGGGAVGVPVNSNGSTWNVG